MFSEYTIKCLKQSGWYPGRKVDVSKHISKLSQEGYVFMNSVFDFLEQYCDLIVKHKNYDSDDEVTVVFSPCWGVDTTMKEVVDSYSARVKMELVPVGTAFDDHMVLCLGDDLSLYAGFDETLFYLGKGDEAVNCLIHSGNFTPIA